MAFLYRTPQQNFMSTLPKEESDAISSIQSKRLLNTESNLGELFNFFVGEEGLKFLTQNGVYVSPNAHVNHTHPVSKMLENHFLFVLVPAVINQRNTLAVSLKKKKAEMLRTRMNSDLTFLNRLIEDKDRSRYSDTSSVGFSISKIHRSLGKADTIFFHDELHHWDYRDIINLLQCSGLNRVIATVVYPIEETLGHESSLNPTNYEFEICGNSIVHAPDGYWSESYTQRRSPEILRAKKIIVGVDTWTVCFHASIGDHHLISIERGEFETKKNLYFNSPQVIPLSWLGFRHLKFSRPLRLRFDLISKALIYLMSLKKPDVESACAKIRQLSEEGLCFDEPFFMAQLALEMKTYDWKKVLNVNSIFGKIKEAIKSMLPEEIQGMICKEETFSRKFIDTILDLKRKPFKIQRGILDDFGLKGIEFDSVNDPFDILINSWHFGDSILLSDRVSRPYCLSGSDIQDFISNPGFKRYNFYLGPSEGNEFNCYKQIPSEREYHILDCTLENWKEIENGCLNFEVWIEEFGKRRKIKRTITKVFKRIYIKVPRSLFCTRVWQVCWHKDYVDILNEDCRIEILEINDLTEPKKEIRETLSMSANDENEKKEKRTGFSVIDRMEIEECADCDVDIVSSSSDGEASAEGIAENLQALQDFEVDTEELKRKILNRELSNICLLEAIGDHLKMDSMTVFSVLFARSNYWARWLMNDEGATLDDVQMCMSQLGLGGNIWTEEEVLSVNENSNFRKIELYLVDNHVYSKPPLKFMNRGKKIISEDKNRMVKTFCKSLEALPLISKVEIEISKRDADNLRSAFERGFTGVLLNSFKFKFENSTCDTMREVYTCMGFAGSGKSRSLINLIKAAGNSRSTLVVSPRKNLIEDWREKLEGIEGTKNWVLTKTFETALRCNFEEIKICVLDEIGLYPHGYIDLISSLLKEDAILILVGDPMQAEYYSKDDKDILETGSCLDKLRRKEYKYALYSHRISKDLHIFGIPTDGFSNLSPNHLKIYSEPAAMFRDMGETNFAILSPSRSYSLHSKKFGSSFTFGEAQGLTFNFSVITLGADGVLCDDGHWMVALTRSREGFAFLLDHTLTLDDFMLKTKGRMIWKVLKKIQISEDHMIKSAGLRMINAICLKSEEKFCAENKIEDRLEGDPWLKGMLNLCELVEVPEPGLNEVMRHDSPPKTHLMVGSGKSTSILISNMKSRERREFRGKGMWSTQFEDTDQKRRNLKVQNWAESVENIYPRHKPDDTLTFLSAVKKRLKFSDPIKNNQALNRAEGVGKVMFQVFKKFLNLSNEVKVDISEIEKKFLAKRIEKSKAIISNHAERSDPDWRLDHFFLFMKSQLCTKYEKRFVEAKAGQTLACFAHKVLVRFGLQTRILEEKIKIQLPSNIYIHTMKNFDDLNDWVLKNIKSSFGTDSDYEAFDRSQDANILAFEIEVLKFFGWDQDLIDDYKKIKLNLGCRLGHLAIMRFTGEFCTFLFNTLANMAFTAMRYFIPEGTPICFAGDDMYAEGYLRKRYDFDWVLEKLSLKAKVNYSSRPLFCGWYITPVGIIKEPRLLLERWEIAEEKGTLSDCLINYSIEASYGYRLGEEINGLIDNIEDFQELIRKVIKKKHKLPHHVRILFESVDGDHSGEPIFEGDGTIWEHHKGCGLQCNLH